jgi:hypothetical protein
MDGAPGDVVFGGAGHDIGDQDPGDALHNVEVVTPNVCFGG